MLAQLITANLAVPKDASQEAPPDRLAPVHRYDNASAVGMTEEMVAPPGSDDLEETTGTASRAPTTPFSFEAQ